MIINLIITMSGRSRKNVKKIASNDAIFLLLLNFTELTLNKQHTRVNITTF